MIRGTQRQPSPYAMSYVPKYIAIAQKSETIPLALDFGRSDVTERKYNYKNSPNQPQAASIARRNARERNRVKQVNDGFNALRKKLPVAVVNALSGGARRGSGKKLSKVDTLRMVVEYIKHLKNLLDETDTTPDVMRSNNSVDTDTIMDTTPNDDDEGIFAGRNSPYSETVPSPANSDCSSGVSSSSSANNDYFSYNNQIYQSNEEFVNSVNDHELLDAISWWQQK